MSDVYKKISELQAKLDPDSCAYAISEQLKDICRRDPACEQILLEDLQNPDMGLAAADKMLYDWGRNHKVGNCCGISARLIEVAAVVVLIAAAASAVFLIVNFVRDFRAAERK